MSKFKVGDKVRCVDASCSRDLTKGKVYVVMEESSNRTAVRIARDYDSSVRSYFASRFELVQEDAVLTPEEVFEHLRKGTKLQLQNSHSGQWDDVITPKYASYGHITTKQWRIKPEPEIITLNGKRYQALED